MYIKKETSGGRGEFEIAGEHNGIKAADLADLDRRPGGLAPPFARPWRPP